MQTFLLSGPVVTSVIYGKRNAIPCQRKSKSILPVEACFGGPVVFRLFPLQRVLFIVIVEATQILVEFSLSWAFVDLPHQPRIRTP